MESFNLNRPLTRLSLAALCSIALFALAACENDESDAQQTTPEDAKVEITHHNLETIQAAPTTDLRDTSEVAFRPLKSSRAEVFPTCREVFETDGEFNPWPLTSETQGPTLFGCDPEGFLELEDGSRIIAYASGIEEDHRATHLQIVSYQPDASIRWENLMDRSHEIRNFAANYRGSFLTAIDDRLICAGTLWQGGTQMLCARRDSGEILYDDIMDFWAGIEPFAFDGSIFSADIRGITRRYPFTGTEMRHRAVDGRGGRSAFYATDQERIFFSPAEDEPILTAWDLATLSPIWRTELPDRPRITYRHVSLQHDLLLLKIEDKLYGFDTKSGDVRMVFEVGESHPPVAFSEDALFLLLRRNEDIPLLYALDPQNGDIRWVGPATTGALKIHYDQKLLVRSVRAVQSVEPGDEFIDD